jgi:hypothetical protein
MDRAAGEAGGADLRVAFDRRLKLEFHGSKVTSDAGLLALRELDDALGLTELAGQVLADTRTGRNGRHTMVAQFRQSVFGRLAGYEDVNDADRLGRDPAMRWIVGGRAVTNEAASTSQMGRFETELLAQGANLVALAELSGRWIDTVHARRPGNVVVLESVVAENIAQGEEITAKYELLGRGTYSASNEHIQNAIFGIDRTTPMELFEARNALRIAHIAAGDKYHLFSEMMPLVLIQRR